MSKIVIFGASGFVGQNIAKGLSKSGHEIIAADISESKFKNIENITYIKNDILDSDNVKIAVSIISSRLIIFLSCFFLQVL